MKKCWGIKIATLSLLLGYAAQAFSGQVFVIANSNLTVDPSSIKSIFLGDTQFSGSVKLEVTDNAAAQSDFLSKALGMDKAKYDGLWVKKSFRDGVTQPPARGTDAEVIDFVKKTPGAIGYVTTAPSGVKVVQQY